MQNYQYQFIKMSEPKRCVWNYMVILVYLKCPFHMHAPASVDKQIPKRPHATTTPLNNNAIKREEVHNRLIFFLIPKLHLSNGDRRGREHESTVYSNRMISFVGRFILQSFALFIVRRNIFVCLSVCGCGCDTASAFYTHLPAWSSSEADQHCALVGFVHFCPPYRNVCARRLCGDVCVCVRVLVGRMDVDTSVVCDFLWPKESGPQIRSQPNVDLVVLVSSHTNTNTDTIWHDVWGKWFSSQPI